MNKKLERKIELLFEDIQKKAKVIGRVVRLYEVYGDRKKEEFL